MSCHHRPRRGLGEDPRCRGFGDLSENSEYDEAKNDQAVMEARIAQLEEQLKHVEIIEAEDIAPIWSRWARWSRS